MKKAVSLLVIAAFVAAFVVVPPPPRAEAGAEAAALGLASFAAAVVLFSIFAKPAPAAVIYPAPQVQPPAPAVSGAPPVQPSVGVVTTPQGVYTRGGLIVGNSATFPIDVYINNQLRIGGLPPSAVVNFPDVYGSGRLLARAPDGKFAEASFWANDAGAQVVLRANDFR